MSKNPGGSNLDRLIDQLPTAAQLRKRELLSDPDAVDVDLDDLDGPQDLNEALTGTPSSKLPTTDGSPLNEILTRSSTQK